MNSRYKKFFIIAIIIIILASVGIVVAARLQPKTTSSGRIQAKVTNVIDKQNQAEDGYKGIEVRASDGKTYTINATGYRNSPRTPAQNNEACVEVPALKKDDNIVFNLPAVKTQPDTFDICYQKDLTGFYLNKQ